MVKTTVNKGKKQKLGKHRNGLISLLYFFKLIQKDQQANRKRSKGDEEKERHIVLEHNRGLTSQWKRLKPHSDSSFTNQTG